MILFRTISVFAVVFAGLAFGSPAKAVSLDLGFGNGGTVITQTGNPPSKTWLTAAYTGNARAITEDRQGRLLAAGGTGSKSLVIRYLPDGSLDTSFGENGRASFPPAIYPDDPERTWNKFTAISVLRDGRILLGVGESSMDRFMLTTESYFVRLLPNGSLDPTFANFPNYFEGPDPFVALAENQAGRILDLQVQPNGKILTAGTYTNSFNGKPRRLGFVHRSQGELPPGGGALALDRRFARRSVFGAGSREIYPAKPPFWNSFSQIKLLGSGNILVGGNLRNRFFVGRLTKAGEWDRSFGAAKNGKVVSEIRNNKGKNCFCAVGSGMDRDRKGRIVLTGWSFPDGTQRTLNLLRYRPNGRPDKCFGKGGKVRLRLNQNVTVRRVVVHPSGKIFVTAWLGLREAQKFAVFAFKPNGKPLRSFFKKGRYIDPIGETSIAEDILIDNRGRLVVSGGTFKDGDASFVIKRFKVG